MFRKKKIKMPRSPIENDSLSQQALDKHVSIICRSALVANDEELAKEIVRRSKVVRYPKGHVLIKHGEDTDDVYFLMFGSTSVLINSRVIDTREAPDTVGEMAAMKPGKARSADVIVGTEKFEARIMPAHEFMGIASANAEFNDQLVNLSDEVGRKNIRLLGENASKTGLSWAAKSAIAGAIVGIIGGVGTWAMQLSSYYYFLGSPSLAVAVFVGVLLVNPDLRYRNLASAAGWGLIGLVLYGSVSFVLTIDGQELDLPLIDFSVQTEQKVATFAIGAVTLLLLTYFAGLLDLKLTKAQGEK